MIEGYVHDDDVHRYFNACDAVVIPRLTDLSSGLVGMGLTFGRLVIAPDHGAFGEYLAGTDNLLYCSGDPKSLATAIERASVVDRAQIESSNREFSKRWPWSKIAGEVLELSRTVAKSRKDCVLI